MWNSWNTKSQQLASSSPPSSDSDAEVEVEEIDADPFPVVSGDAVDSSSSTTFTSSAAVDINLSSAIDSVLFSSAPVDSNTQNLAPNSGTVRPGLRRSISLPTKVSPEAGQILVEVGGGA